MSLLSSQIKLYSINNYAEANEKFINQQALIVNGLDNALNHLQLDKGYHLRIHKNEQYLFFGDLDNYPKDIGQFITILQNFMDKQYKLTFTVEDFQYTQNNENPNSYHYVIPKWNASTEKLKEIHHNLLKECPSEFCYQSEKGITKRCIDTTIYSEHWFRLPGQKKGQHSGGGKHIVKKGELKYFLLPYIEDTSVNINDIGFHEVKSKTKIILQRKDNELIELKNHTDVENKEQIIEYDADKLQKDNILSAMMSQPVIYKKMFDECYKQERFDIYESWISVGMAIRNTFDNDTEAFDLFNYFSSKGHNYDGIDATKNKFHTFVKKKTMEKYTVATIYYYAIEDNKPRFIEIMNKNTFDLEQYDMCKYIKLLAGKRFIYSISGGSPKLYCFNGKIWESDVTLFKNFLSCELYEFLKMILIELYFDHRMFSQMKAQITKLKLASFKKDIVETYKEIGLNKSLKFDDNPYLLGFNNLVYDLENGYFREYKYDDYISITTGYDWREPTIDEISTVNKLIELIMPIKEERDCYLQILATTLDGKCLEKCIIHNGAGGNGKGCINDILIMGLGHHALVGNNAILFETNKSGSNPEKANIHKKRLVIFREPPEKNRFANSVIKELTGGGYFSARGHHESETQKELNLTMIIECNKKPLFSEEPTNAEVRRIIDIYFRSTFTSDPTLVDIENHIYLANEHYKEKTFQEKHKFALLKILMLEYNKYIQNGHKFTIPQSIITRTHTYLELSCNLVSWFKENYQHTGNSEDICKIKDIYDTLTNSVYFNNLTKYEKQKYSKAYVLNYVENNIFFRKFYKARSNTMRHFISEWKPIENSCELDNLENIETT